MKKILLIKANQYKKDLNMICKHLSDTYTINTINAVPSYETILTYDLIISSPIKFPYTLKKACFFIINDLEELEIIEKQFYTQIINGHKFYTSCMKAIELLYHDTPSFIVFKGRKFAYHDIVYLTHINRHVVLKTTTKEYTMRDALKNYEYLLENYRFFKSHSSFIVNIAYVDHIKNHDLYLKDGSTIPISRKYQNSEYITYFHND